MIPKIIHYCWFGRGEKNELIRHCMDSWKKHLPDYDIVEWNEDRFDVDSTLWTKQAYEAKKWAFVSDYVRLYALNTQGGLYFDTDVEILKPLDHFLDNDLLLGFESKDMPTTAVIGAKAGNQIIQTLLCEYMEKPFLREDGSYDTLPNPYVIMPYLEKLGIRKNGREQFGSGYHIYPAIVFSPNNFTRIWDKPSAKSYSIHHFDQSWSKEKKNTKAFGGKVRRYIVGVLRNLFGTKNTFLVKDKLRTAFGRKSS